MGALPFLMGVPPFLILPFLLATGQFGTVTGYKNDQVNYFNPQNFMENLPSLALPYINSLPIPSNQVSPQIKATPVVTKVVSVVTKWVGKNPVCLKVSGKKPPCKIDVKKNAALEYLITKEYFVRNPQEFKDDAQDGGFYKYHGGDWLRTDGSYSDAHNTYPDFGKALIRNKSNQRQNEAHTEKGSLRDSQPFENSQDYKIDKDPYNGHKFSANTSQFGSHGEKLQFVLNKIKELGDIELRKFQDRQFLKAKTQISDFTRQFNLEGSETPLISVSRTARTPKLSPSKVKELLIEDRLDHLEEILPHYTRRRVYQTSTITVTKVRSNNKATATLIVKNCIPQGIDICPSNKKKKKKKSSARRKTPERFLSRTFH